MRLSILLPLLRGLARCARICSACFVILTFCGCLAGRGQDSWQHYQNGGMFDAGCVSLSPDGQCLAYASACTGHGDIYLIKNGAASPTRLTDSDDFESSPIFTPDGKRIVFRREHDQRSHLRIMDADGTKATPLTKGNNIDYPRDISHDGRFLLFNRAKPTMGLGLTDRAYVMRLDEPDREPISVGDLAVFSGDSRSVVYSEGDSLWRMDLGENPGNRRKIPRIGMPVDVSADGRVIMAIRLPSETQMGIDREIWIIDTKTNTEKKLATGHDPVFLGAKSTHVLFFTGYEPKLFVAATDGTPPVPIQCAPSHMTKPRRCLDGSGVVLGASMENGRPAYSVLFIDLESRRATTIASLGCSSVTFHSPTKTNRNQ